MIIVPNGQARSTLPFHWACLALAVSATVLGASVSTRAQSLSAVYPVQVTAETRANFFIDWPETQIPDALLIGIPPDWRLIEVRSLVDESGQYRSAELTRFTDNTYLVEGIFDESVHRAVLRVHVGSQTQSAVVAVSSVQLNGARVSTTLSRIELDATVNPAVRVSSGGALAAFGTSSLSLGRLPRGDDLTFTVEYWLRTLEMGQIVMTTWDGRESSSYPFEFVIDANGRLVCYMGSRSRHLSLRSDSPVADGQWHHIAFSARPGPGHFRLYLDGIGVDSLFNPSLPTELSDFVVMLAGRHDMPEPASPSFQGHVDEIRLWPVARTGRQIRDALRIPMRSGQSEAIVFGFDDERVNIEGLGQHWARIDSDLELHRPVENLRARQVPGSVDLSWRLEASEAQTIVLEKSYDGTGFTRLYENRIDSRQVGLSETFAYSDFDLPVSGVAFYRVTQQFANGGILKSKVIKLSLVEPEVPGTVELLGNSPNPFSTSTEIVYRVREPAQVRVTVWDVSGHLVEQFTNEMAPPGLHRALFVPDGLPSGPYFVRIETSHTVQTAKMVHTK